MRSPALSTHSRIKNVSFDAGIMSNLGGSASSSYLALRNKGYLTSDILGSKNITAEMIGGNHLNEYMSKFNLSNANRYFRKFDLLIE